MSSFQKYPNYKPSGVEWLGDVPAHWEVVTLGSIMRLRSEKNHPELEVLSVYRDYGVIPKDSRDDNHNATSLDQSTYKLVEQGDLVINKMKAWQGSMGISQYYGIVSPAYITCKIISNKVFSPFLHQLLRCGAYIGVYNQISYGVRVGQWDMHFEDFKKITTLLPPLAEQTRIAQFLDQKTAQIDTAIAQKQRQIELLRERRQIIIQQAVTQGLNPHVKMRDSGVAWIGMVPEHWEVRRLKYLFNEINERSETGAEELMSVSHLTGVTPRSEKNVSMFKSEDYSGAKICRKGDLVINIMWAWMGALGISDRTGIVSSSYGVFRQKKFDTFNMVYLEELLKSFCYIEHYNQVSTGLHFSRLRFYSHMFLDMKIGYPSTLEQNEIVLSIKSLNHKTTHAIALKEREIEKLKEYKSVLIDAAVTGKIKI